jgi:hypothetical protein
MDETGMAPSTLVLLILGLAVLVCGGIYECHTTRDALFPPAAFNLTTGREWLDGFLLKCH